jgi:tetratricopeptide (TPR) repeat protein
VCSSDLLARAASRALASGGPERALLLASVVLSGGMLLFFGCVEYYPLMQAALLLYLVLAVRFLRGRGTLALPTAALLLAVLLHISAIAVVPSWLFLLGRGVPARRLFIRLFGVLLLAGAAAWGIFRYTEKFYGGSEAFLPLLDRGAHSYAFLSRHHAAFVGNEIFLLLGGALLLPLIRFIHQGTRDRSDEEARVGRFLGGTALLSLLYLLLVDPYLGSRDWDLMALPLFPCLLWLGHAFLGAREGTGEGTAALLAGAMFLHSFPWIAAQVDRDRAVAMTVSMTIRDPHYANPAARAPKAFGVLLAQAGYTGEAALFFEKAAEIREDAQNLFNLGTSRARSGDHAEAVRLLSRAIEREPRYAQAYVNLALSLLRLGEAERAEEALRAVLAFAPEYARAHRALGFALAEKRAYEEALASFRRAVEIEPSDAESWMRIGLLLSSAGSAGEAADALRRALAIDPGNAEAEDALRRIEGEEMNRVRAP